MVKEADNHDRVRFVVHRAVNGNVRTRLAVALAEVTGELDARRQVFGLKAALDDFNVAIVPA